MADFFSTRTNDDVTDNYETVVSFEKREFINGEGDTATNPTVCGVEDEEYTYILNERFEIPSEKLKSKSSGKVKLEVTRYKGTEQMKIRFIDFIN